MFVEVLIVYGTTGEETSAVIDVVYCTVGKISNKHCCIVSRYYCVSMDSSDVQPAGAYYANSSGSVGQSVGHTL